MLLNSLIFPEQTITKYSRIKQMGVLASILLTLMATNAYAYDFSDTTLGGTTWNRPTVDDSGLITGLSSAGTSVSYSLLPFFVDTTGSYSFLSTGTNPTNWDNFTVLYQDNFDSSLPLSNAVIGNDDYNLITGESGFDNVTLTANSQYYFVTTGFSDSDEGAFSGSINGPGNVKSGFVAVPEMNSLSFLGLGIVFSGIYCQGIQRRRKNAENRE